MPGLGLAAPGPWPAAARTLFALHHGLVRGALMLGTGAGGALPLAILSLLSLALARAPHTVGALAKAWFGHLADTLPGALPEIVQGLLSLTATATAMRWRTSSG